MTPDGRERSYTGKTDAVWTSLGKNVSEAEKVAKQDIL